MQKRLALFLIIFSILTSLAIIFMFLRSPFLGNLISPYNPSRNLINIDFKFGVTSRNELNTFNGTYTKDLLRDGTITTRLILTQEELSQIQTKLLDIDFFNYPETFPSKGIQMPREEYCIKVQNDTIIKEVTWYSDSFQHDYTNETKTNLNQLYDLVWSMITTKIEYKLLPAANGYYC